MHSAHCQKLRHPSVQGASGRNVADRSTVTNCERWKQTMKRPEASDGFQQSAAGGQQRAGTAGPNRKGNTPWATPSLCAETLLNLPGRPPSRLRAPHTGSIDVGQCTTCRANNLLVPAAFSSGRGIQGGYDYLDALLSSEDVPNTTAPRSRAFRDPRPC